MNLVMRTDPGKNPSCRKDGYLFVLSNLVKEHISLDGVSGREYMITGLLGTHPKGLIVMPTTNCVLVHHDGFECCGTMCATTAHGYIGSLSNRIWITPGRVQDLIHVASNVNVGWNGQEKVPLKPGRVFVQVGERRAAGLPEVSDIDPDRWKAVLAHRERGKNRGRA